MNRSKYLITSLSAPILIYPLYKYIHKENKTYYTKQEVSKHNKENDIWVTYHNKVYDITKFIEYHPGGKEKILEAAGKSIKPYWNKYPIHNENQVKDILDTYLVGELSDYKIEDDIPKVEIVQKNNINILKTKPFNAEPELKKLRENYITPIKLWYSRNHHELPNIDIKDYKLEIIYSKNNNTSKLKTYTYQDIFDKKTSIVNTIQCAGNRRREFNEKTSKKVLGLNWEGGAISNAKFTGIYLRDILKNILDTNQNFNYIQFIGHDEPFDGSIFINKEQAMNSDILLAYKMNDEYLTKETGYPLRVIVPGYSGAKNIKWLKKIVLSDKESDSTWQKGVAYKHFGPNVTDFSQISEDDKKKIPTVEKLPVQSIICDISKDSKILIIKGIAYSGGGNNIIRVEVSIDNGNKWINALLKEGSKQPPYKAYAWTFWEAIIPLEEITNKNLDIVCKATDINYNTQPKDIKDIWNLRGILNNSWMHVKYSL